MSSFFSSVSKPLVLLLPVVLLLTQLTPCHAQDAELAPEITKLIRWLDGTPAQKDLAALALRMTPAEATPQLAVAASDTTLSSLARKDLALIVKRHTTARQRILDEQAKSERFIKNAVTQTYAKIARPNTLWHDDAVKLLQLFADQRGNTPEFADLALRIMDAGCDEPFVNIHLNSQLGKDCHLPTAKRLELVRQVLAMDNIPVSRKIYAIRFAAFFVPPPTTNAAKLGDPFPTPWNGEEKQQILELLKQSIPLFPAFLQEDPPERIIRSAMNELIGGYCRITNDERAWKELGQPLADNLPPSNPPLPQNATAETVHGDLLLIPKNFLRGARWANEVPEANWAAIQQYTTDAIHYFKAAVDADNDYYPATYMVMAMQRNDTNNLVEQKLWFKKVCETNPDSSQAAYEMTVNLMRRWTGRSAYDQDLQKLARACMLSRNFDAQIPQTAFYAWRAIAEDMNNEDAVAAFWSSPQMRVDVRYLYDTVLSRQCTWIDVERAARLYYTSGSKKRALEAFRLLPANYTTTDPYRPTNWKEIHQTLRDALKPGAPELTDLPLPTSRPTWTP